MDIEGAAAATGEVAGGAGAAPGAGSAADILGTGAGVATGTGAGGAVDAGADPRGAAVVAGSEANDNVDPDWYANVSAEADGENSSHRDWVKSLKVADIDGLVKIARDNQKALRDSGRVKVPGDDASADEIAAFNKAIGVPDEPGGYVIAAPQDDAGNPVPLDTQLLDALSASAHRHGLPKSAYEAVVGDFIKAQIDSIADADRQAKSEAEAVVKQWGGEATAKLAAIDRAAETLGIGTDDLVALRNAWGSEKALNHLVRLGEGMSEDVMVAGGRVRFGTSGVAAKAELDALKTSKTFDPVNNTSDKARWDRLNDAIAADVERQRRTG